LLFGVLALHVSYTWLSKVGVVKDSGPILL